MPENLANIVFVNSEFVPREKAVVSIFDREILYGDGLFETMRCYKGRIFLLERHLQRLFDSARELQIEINASLEKN